MYKINKILFFVSILFILTNGNGILTVQNQNLYHLQNKQLIELLHNIPKSKKTVPGINE